MLGVFRRDFCFCYYAPRTLAWLVLVAMTFQFLNGSICAQPLNYTFTKIATSLYPLYEFFPEQSPHITEDGQVLFFARLSDGGDGAYVFGDEDSQEILVSWSTSFGSLFGPRQVNCSGDVVFIEDLGPTANQLYHWSAQQGLNVLYAGTGGQDSLRFLDSDQPSINNNGDVAFIADGQGFGSDTVFLGSLKGELPVEVIASIFDGFSRFFSVYISDAGDVIARGDRSGVRGIYKFTASGQIQTIATVGAKFEFIGDFDANCKGQALFGGTVAGNSVLYFGDENGIELVAQEDSSFDLVQGQGVNDHGELVYSVRVFGDLGGGQTLQIGPDIVDDRLIGAGDSLFGHTIRNVSAGEESINNRGQIAFQATWTDPSDGNMFRTGIIVATPVLLGDVNLDGVVDLLDVAPFAALLASNTFQDEADVNSDGQVNLLDVAPFVELLLAG